MNSRSRLLTFGIGLLALGLLTATAHADNYVYTFSGNANLSSGATETIGFQYTAANPITSFSSMTESQLNYCTNCQLSGFPVLSFLPGNILGDSIVFDDFNGVGAYLFSAGAFGNTGTYTSGGIFDAGTLNVSTSVGSVIAVPEPGTVQLGLVGAAFLAFFALGQRKLGLKSALQQSCN
jgi:PEP-CTERM motif